MTHNWPQWEFKTKQNVPDTDKDSTTCAGLNFLPMNHILYFTTEPDLFTYCCWQVKISCYRIFLVCLFCFKYMGHRLGLYKYRFLFRYNSYWPFYVVCDCRRIKGLILNVCEGGDQEMLIIALDAPDIPRMITRSCHNWTFFLPPDFDPMV